MSNGITGNMQAALFHCGRIKRTDLRLGMAWNYVLSGAHSGHWNWSSCFGHLIPDGTGSGNWRKIIKNWNKVLRQKETRYICLIR